MDKKFFEVQINFTRGLIGDYSIGYQHGLRRAFYGDDVQVYGGHDYWLSLKDDRGIGYRDGYAGKPHKDSHIILDQSLKIKKETIEKSVVNLRVDVVKKSAWVQHAKDKGMTLSSFIEKTLDDYFLNYKK